MLRRPVYKKSSVQFSPGCVKALSHVITSVIIAYARVCYTRTKYLNATMPKGKCVHAIEGRPSVSVQQLR